MKEYIYHYSGTRLDRLAVMRWNQIQSRKRNVIEYANCTIRIIFAYVDIFNHRPVYCRHIDAINCSFDSEGYYISPSIPDFGLLSHCVQEKVLDMRIYRQRNEFRYERYWQVSPQLREQLLATIWNE